MNQRKLGNKGFDVSEVGLGCWQLGGDWGQEFDQARAEAIFDVAIEAGTAFFDTADVYGGGLSESFIGNYLEQRRDLDVKVATKFGREQVVFPDKYTKDLLKEGVERSLSRLKTDKIDLLQLHCIPTEVMEAGDIFDWLREIQDEGLISHFGASVETVEEAQLCLKVEGLQSLQVIFNIFRQKLVRDLLPDAQQKGVGIIARVPLASGVLTGKFSKETTFEKTDHRHFNSDGQLFNVGETFAGVPMEDGVEYADRIASTYKPDGMTMAQFALRWIIDHPAVSTVIPGASSPEQARDNAAVSDFSSLDDSVYTALKDMYWTEIHEKVRGAY